MTAPTIDALGSASPPHVFLGLIARHVVTVATFMTALRLQDHARKLGFRVSCGVEETGGIALARNLLVETFYDRVTDAGWFLSFDDDVGRLSGADLLRMLQHRVDVVGAPLPGRAVSPESVQRALAAREPLDSFLNIHENLSPLLMAFENGKPHWVSTDLVEVESTSAGCLLISREAVTTMIAKHGRGSFVERGRTRSYPRLFNFTDDVPDDSFQFCKSWRELGGHVYVDARTTLTHRGVVDFTTKSLGSLLGVPEEAAPLERAT